MICWPVIIRELRTEARRPFNFWLRLLGVGAITLVFAVSMLEQSGSSSGLGARLFGNLNATLFVAIWVLVPLLTADCISQEKRDGTLGLLFLTRLTASGIVVGKSLIHALRSATLLLGMMPVLAVPFLLGGVSWKDGVLAWLLNSSAVILALTAGLLASTVARDWARALILALPFSFTFAAVFMLIHFLGCIWLDARLGLKSMWGSANFHQAFHWFWNQNILSKLTQTFFICTNLPGEGRYFMFSPFLPAGGFWSQTWAVQPLALQHAWLEWAGILLGLSLLMLLFAVHLAAYYVRRFWRDEPPSRQKVWLLEMFCTPKFQRRFFQNRMTRELDRNPIGWLQQYSWSGRLTKWGWCLAALMIECMLVCDTSLTWLWSGQYGLAQLLMLGLAFTASGSFREEQRTGALELLLVTPLNERQLIGGRVRGIWSQFFPAALVLALAWLFLAKDARWFADDKDATDTATLLALPIFFVTTYLTLPLAGLYFSIRRLNFIAAWLLTCLINLFLPMLIFTLALRAVDLTRAICSLLFVQLAVALAAWLLLNRELRRRSFSFPRGRVSN